MYADSPVRSGSVAKNRDLREPLVPANETEMRCRGEVAEDGAWPAGLDSRKEAALKRKIGVPDRIYPAVHSMQATIRDTNADGVVREPAVAQLVERQHAPLLARAAGDAHIRATVEFVGLSPMNSTVGG